MVESIRPHVSDSRPSIYYDEKVGCWVYRISAFGSCENELLALRLGYTPDDKALDGLQGIFGEGDLHEQAVLQTLTSEGWEILTKQEVIEDPIPVVILDGAPVVRVLLRGHTDGRIKPSHQLCESSGWGDDDCLLEVKAFGDSTFNTWTRLIASVAHPTDDQFSANPSDWPIVPVAWEGWERYPKYAWQISEYSVALELPYILYAVKSRNDGRLSRSWILPPFSREQITQRVREIEFMAAMGEVRMCERSGFRCPFPMLHDYKPMTAASLTGPDAELLESFLTRYHWLTGKIKAYELERDGDEKKGVVGLREKILNLLGNAEKGVAGGFSVSVTQGTSERLDQTRAKRTLEELGQLADHMTLTPWQRVTVKDLNENKEKS